MTIEGNNQTDNADDAAYGYDSTSMPVLADRGWQGGYVWPANVMAVGLVGAYMARFYELVNLPASTDLAPDPSAFRLLAQAGDVFRFGIGGLLVLVAAALIVRYRPPADGVRNAVGFSAVIVLAGSIGAVLSSVMFNDRVTLFDQGDWASSLLIGSGVQAVQAAVALGVLAYERDADQVPNIAVVGLLASSVMGLSSGVFIEYSGSHELGDRARLAQYFSGGNNLDWMALMAAGLLVALTGRAVRLRGIVVLVAAATVAVALAFIVLSSIVTPDFAQFSVSRELTAPSAILAAVVAGGIALIPFDRSD